LGKQVRGGLLHQDKEEERRLTNNGKYNSILTGGKKVEPLQHQEAKEKTGARFARRVLINWNGSLLSIREGDCKSMLLVVCLVRGCIGEKEEHGKGSGLDLKQSSFGGSTWGRQDLLKSYLKDRMYCHEIQTKQKSSNVRGNTNIGKFT